MGTGVAYMVKKCAKIVFKNTTIIKGEGQQILQERMKALDPNKNEIYKFQGYEQAERIDMKKVIKMFIYIYIYIYIYKICQIYIVQSNIDAS